MNNQEKHDVYAKLSVDLRKALYSGFYLQAVFIEYAMFEDRLNSLLKHAGLSYTRSNGKDININQKISKVKNNYVDPFSVKRLTPELMDQIEKWKDNRNDLVHHLVNISFDDEEIKKIALEGNELLKVFKSRVSSVNRHHEGANQLSSVSTE